MRRPGDSVTGILPPPGENALADDIREAIGAGSDEDVQFTTSQFIRPVGEPPPAPGPRDRRWWDVLREMDERSLREIGLRAWNNPDDPDDTDADAFGRRGVLMLFPGEWYASIPSGFEVVDISGQREHFIPGHTDDDIRFGHLAYGIVVQRQD